jgi:hypothetical protein
MCRPLRVGTLLAVEFLLFNFVELKRLQDFNKPGSQAEPGSFFGLESAFKGTGGENGYPGGVFDPLGFSRRGPRAVPAAGALPLVPGSTLTGMGRDRAGKRQGRRCLTAGARLELDMDGKRQGWEETGLLLQRRVLLRCHRRPLLCAAAGGQRWPSSQAKRPDLFDIMAARWCGQAEARGTSALPLLKCAAGAAGAPRTRR